MTLAQVPKRYRFPGCVISQAVWLYHHFNPSYRDVQDQLAFRGIILSHETVRARCLKVTYKFRDVLKKQDRKLNDKWHLDEIALKIKGQTFILWRAVDSQGSE